MAKRFQISILRLMIVTALVCVDVSLFLDLHRRWLNGDDMVPCFLGMAICTGVALGCIIGDWVEGSLIGFIGGIMIAIIIVASVILAAAVNPLSW